MIRDIEADEPGPGRLKRLVRRAFDGRLSVDRAVRSWAAQDVAVAKVVASVDAGRVAYIASLLVAAGVENRKALDRAAFLYWAYLGQAIMMDPRHASIAAAGLDEIVGLFEKSAIERSRATLKSWRRPGGERECLEAVQMRATGPPLLS